MLVVIVVDFGSIPATRYTVESPTLINAIAPTTVTASAPRGSAGSVDVTVTNLAGASSTSVGDQYTISGPVTINGGSAMVAVGELNQHGTLTLENNTGGIYFVGSQIDGRVYVENNTAPVPVENGVMNNTVTGSLYCSGNNPAPSDNGILNTVTGTASDQCAALAKR